MKHWKSHALALALASAALSPVAAQTAGLPAASSPSQAADLASIRKVMLDTWDQPDARLDVGPISVDAGHAVAGWTQGERGGRALLTRDAQGYWQVSACGGDGLKDAKTLALTGMRPEAARRLAGQVAQAEARIDPKRRALFSTFDGMVRMDAAGNHPPHGEEKPR